MDQRTADAQLEGRPYRSHKLPACSACRQRKVRCLVDGSSRLCHYCRQRGVECDRLTTRALPNGKAHRSGRMAGSPTPKVKNPRSSANAASTISPNALEATRTSDESSPLMMNPTMAEDVDVLERHLVSHGGVGVLETRPYIRISNSLGESIVYRTVPRQRKGLQNRPNPGVAQREIMENVLGPFSKDVVHLYFDRVQPCFPILDEASFWDLWKKDPMRISSTLMCDIYAVALLYWNTSHKLRQHQQPDTQFAWNQAVMALRDDFMAPSMTTVHAALLDMLGRPIYQVTGNIVNAGRSVTLAHSLGLHRDPSTWRMNDTEKNLRTRYLIYDRSSLSHGTPPNISRQNYDVVLPLPESVIGSGASETVLRASMSFIHLCSLTRILGDILPLIYSLYPTSQDIWKTVRRIECALDEWEDHLPSYLNADKKDDLPCTENPGASGLWFYFLSLKLTLHRLAVKTTLHDGINIQPEVKSFHASVLRSSALKIVGYAASLQSDQFQEFWLPSTTTLLRCTVDYTNLEERREPIMKLLELLKNLKWSLRCCKWDLAESCIETCGPSIESIAAANLVTTQAAAPTPQAGLLPEVFPGNGGAIMDVNDTTCDDAFLGNNSLEIPWDYLLDDMHESWYPLE
ncbi:hypothetical protein LTS10_004969 [Elasticomyces elasticus]|nr:hypothetical protein LTS10_004969 [Elasticomyces elasticus]